MIFAADDFFPNHLIKKMEITIKSKNISDPDQANIFLSGLIWVQTVCKVYQQMTIEGKELRIQACV